MRTDRQTDKLTDTLIAKLCSLTGRRLTSYMKSIGRTNCIMIKSKHVATVQQHASITETDVQKLCNMCVLSLSLNFFVSHDKYIHCKAVEQRATLIHRQYNRDWGTSYSRPPIDPYLTSPMLQNPGGATGIESLFATATVW